MKSSTGVGSQTPNSTFYPSFTKELGNYSKS